jgi:kynurenine formamidase
MLIDLSLPVKNNTPEPDSPKIRYLNHKEGARHLIRAARRMVFKINLFKGMIFSIISLIAGWAAGLRSRSKPRPKLPFLTLGDFPDSSGLANEEIVLDSHAGTHLDAPWHFGPRAGGRDAMTVDRIPLEWCYSDGVVLDFRRKKPGDSIDEEDIVSALKSIGYEIKPMDIVLIMTGADRHFELQDYFSAHPGMSAEAVKYLIRKGIKVMGIDAWGFDRPAARMLGDFIRTGDQKYIFPAHFAGREMEYCHIEKLANLDKIPRPFGFKVICFPVKIENASAGWCRTVAIV